MSAAYLHLILNHIPILGTIFSTLLLSWGLIKKSGDIQKASLFALVLVTLLAIPTYLAGESAEKQIEGLPGVWMPAVEAHDDAAAFAFTGQLIIGLMAGGALFQARKLPIPRRWATSTVLVGCLVVSGLMIWTARLGGQIHHPEIRRVAPLSE